MLTPGKYKLDSKYTKVFEVRCKAFDKPGVLEVTFPTPLVSGPCAASLTPSVSRSVFAAESMSPTGITIRKINSVWSASDVTVTVVVRSAHGMTLPVDENGCVDWTGHPAGFVDIAKDDEEDEED